MLPGTAATAPLVGADLDVMARDSRNMRGDGPFVFAQVTNHIGVAEIIDHLQRSWSRATNRAPRNLSGK